MGFYRFWISSAKRKSPIDFCLKSHFIIGISFYNFLVVKRCLEIIFQMECQNWKTMFFICFGLDGHKPIEKNSFIPSTYNLLWIRFTCMWYWMSQFDGQSAVNNIRQISHIRVHVSCLDNVYYTFKSQEHHNIRLTSIAFFLHGDLPLIQKYAYFKQKWPEKCKKNCKKYF